MTSLTPFTLAKFMHEEYEIVAREEGWRTQEPCKVKWAKLPEANKATMLRVAEAVYSSFPTKCPIWQCGGTMKHVERRPPKGMDPSDPQEYDGDFQTPDLVCTNCGGVYRFSGFKKRRPKSSSLRTSPSPQSSRRA